MSTRLSLIWAMAENGTIGIDNRLPWHLPADLKRFRAITSGRAILMGRRTFESFPRPLPDRLHVIITRDQKYRAPVGCIVVHSLSEALRVVEGGEEAFVIGGASLYRQTLPLADRLYVTLVHAAVPGDTGFPALDWTGWRELEREDHAADERHAYPYSFLILERAADNPKLPAPM